MPTFTLNGRELTVPDGTTILQAALKNGIEIPHYCYHDGLSIAGNCRICLVEIEKFPKPAIACNTVVTDGMVVETESEKVHGWRNGVMEFLLVNHPLDCPICDQAGECKLQEYSYKHGQATTRFDEEKEHGPKRRELGPHVLFDWERCIKCTRCIRFCEDVTGTGELGMFLRGVREEIGVFPGKPLDNPYSGNVVDLCPVGALTLREFRFRSRVWFVSNVPSTCPGCARGCSVDLGLMRNQLYRITPRENQDVNRWWLCDEGRLWGERLAKGAEARLAGARVAGREAAPSWEAALAAAGSALGAAAKKGRVRVLASARASVEASFLLAKLAAGPLAGAPIHLAEHERGEDDALLIRKDRTPNRLGVQLVVDAVGGGLKPIDELSAALDAGEVDVLLALGPGLVGPVGDEGPVLPREQLEKAGQRIVLDAHASLLSETATVLLPVAGFGESDGTYVSFAGRASHSASALLPQRDARPLVMLLGDLYDALASDKAPAPAALGAAISAEVPAFAELDWEQLPGSLGQDLVGYDAAKEACRVTGAAEKMMASGWKF